MNPNRSTKRRPLPRVRTKSKKRPWRSARGGRGVNARSRRGRESTTSRMWIICAAIIADGGLWSDATMIAAGVVRRVRSGWAVIKQRCVCRLPVYCHPGDYVGDFVPFYFCPRSIMLFLIHCANHPDLPIAVARNRSCIWKRTCTRSWHGRTARAGAGPSVFPMPDRITPNLRSRLDHLAEIDLECGRGHRFSFIPRLRKGNRPSFSFMGSFHGNWFGGSGCVSGAIAAARAERHRGAAHRPPVEILRDWYY